MNGNRDTRAWALPGTARTRLRRAALAPTFAESITRGNYGRASSCRL